MKCRIFILASLMLIICTSCYKEVSYDVLEETSIEGVSVKPVLVLDPIDDENVIILGDGSEMTKSQYTGSDSDNTVWEINSDVNYYLFRNGYLAKQGYVADFRNLSITCPNSSYTYTLYMVMNYGVQYSIGSSSSESYMTSYDLSYNSSNYNNRIQTKGLPRYAKVTNFSASYNEPIHMTTLAHKLRVQIDTKEIPNLSGRKITVTSLGIYHGAYNVKPFASSSVRSATDINNWTSDPVDIATEDDLEKINNGEIITLYLLENMCGTHSSISSWDEKIPLNLPSNNNISGGASLLSFTCREETVSSSISSLTYRCYLGSSPSDFNVPRNSSMLFTPKFTGNFVGDTDWNSEYSNLSERVYLKPERDIAGNILLCNFPLETYIYQYVNGNYVKMPSKYIESVTIGNCTTPGFTSVPKPTMDIYTTNDYVKVDFSTNQKVEYMGEWEQEPLYAVFPVYIKLTDGRTVENNVKIQLSAFNVDYITANGKSYDPATSNSDPRQYYECYFGIMGDSYARKFMLQNNLKFTFDFMTNQNYGRYLDYSGSSPSVYENVDGSGYKDSFYISTFVSGSLDYKSDPWHAYEYHRKYYFPDLNERQNSISAQSYSSIDNSISPSLNMQNVQMCCIAKGYFDYSTGTYYDSPYEYVLSGPIRRMMNNNYAYKEYDTVLHTDAGFYHFPGYTYQNDTNDFTAQLVIRLGLSKTEYNVDISLGFYSPLDMIVGGKSLNQSSTLDYHVDKGSLLPIHFPLFVSQAINNNLYSGSCTQDYCSRTNTNRAVSVNNKTYYRIFLHSSQCFYTSTNTNVLSKLINSSPEYEQSLPMNMPVYNKRVETGYMENPSYNNLKPYTDLINFRVVSPLFTPVPVGFAGYYCPFSMFSNPGLYIAFCDPSTTYSNPSQFAKYYYAYCLQRFF